MEQNLYGKVRRAILKQESPFCISDLYRRLEHITDDREIILECLDQLYDAGVIAYREIEKNLWAFVVS